MVMAPIIIIIIVVKIRGLKMKFTFRPTESTTAADIYLLQVLTELLQSHDYV